MNMEISKYICIVLIITYGFKIWELNKKENTQLNVIRHKTDTNFNNRGH